MPTTTKARATRQDPRWPRAHERLREIFQERLPDGMTQEEFGELHGIGSQGMVWQYLNGWTPLNIEAAAKFAKGLNCTIADISPEMAAEIKEAIVVRLGKISRRVAMAFAGALCLSALSSHDAQAQSVLHNAFSQSNQSGGISQVIVLIHIVRRRLRKAANRVYSLLRSTIPAFETPLVFRTSG